jgi:hypothetical protein
MHRDRICDCLKLVCLVASLGMGSNRRCQGNGEMKARLSRCVPSIPLRLAVFIACPLAAGAAFGQESFQAFRGEVTPTVDRQTVQRWGVPFQRREPAKFWQDRYVYQKQGVVIGDTDFVVREQFWVLDSRHVGRVESVAITDAGVRCRVLFSSMDTWTKQGIPMQVKSETQEVELEEKRPGEEPRRIKGEIRVTTTEKPEVAVSRGDVGFIVERLDDGTVLVEFPAELLRLELPRMNDRVVRGPDWSVGYADGGDSPYGEAIGDSENAIGRVLASADADGNFDIEWEATGRTSTARFDAAAGFYDVVKVHTESPQEDGSSEQANGGQDGETP